MGEPRGNVHVIGPASEMRPSILQSLARAGYEVSEHQALNDFLHRFNPSDPPAAVVFEAPAQGDHTATPPIERIVRRARRIPIVVVSPNATPEAIVQTMKLGATDYLIPPLQEGELARALERVRAVRRFGYQLPAGELQIGNGDDFLRLSPIMEELERTARQIADSDLTVLIQGESGSGKEMLARFIHRLSNRSHEPLVKVNCAALPEELLESELFGYEKGAFTGAVSRKIGKFEAANQGTIFLDEIAEMSGRVQAKLLHVLQDKRFSRLGSNRVIEVDVRVLAATNRNLTEEVEQGRFREDLYFRLKVIDLQLPPLRDRRAEIPSFVRHFAHRFANQYRRPVPEPSDRLMGLFQEYPFSGNIRELENMMKRLVILGDESSIIRELLTRQPRAGDRTHRPSQAEPVVHLEPSLKKIGRRAALAAQKGLILSTLEKTRWNRRNAARLLGVSYKTLLKRMKDCGITEA